MAERVAGNSIFPLGRRKRGAEVRTGAILVAPEAGRTLSVFDLGTGAKVPEAAPSTGAPLT